MAKSHSPEQGLESGILAHRIELSCGRNQNQGTVPLVIRAVEPLKQALEIAKTEVDQGDPHRRHVAVRGTGDELLQVCLRQVPIASAPIRVAEDGDVVHRPTAQLDRQVELPECPVVLPFLRARIPERIVCKGKRRLQCQHLLELRDRAIEIVVEIVDVADLRLQLEIQGVQSLGLVQFDDGMVMLPFKKGKSPCVPEMRRRRAGTELQGAGEGVLRCLGDPSRGPWR